MKIAIALVLLIVLLMAILEIRRELRIFQVTHYLIASPKLNTFSGEHKIIFLSDLHDQQYGTNNEELLDAIKKEEPWLILIGGDMMISKEGKNFELAREFVAQLPAIAPVYYANGNHEQRVKEFPKRYQMDFSLYRQELEALGVIFLENETVTLVKDQVRIHLTGLEIPVENYQHLRMPPLALSEIEERIGQAKDGYNILLAHNPAYVEVYKDWGADLILSGHFHGGIIRIPGMRGLIIPGFGKYKRYSGSVYLDGDKRIVVSRGLGNHTVKLRLFNKAEVITLHLQGKEGIMDKVKN